MHSAGVVNYMKYTRNLYFQMFALACDCNDITKIFENLSVTVIIVFQNLKCRVAKIPCKYWRFLSEIVHANLP